jgi:hypothetical protein
LVKRGVQVVSWMNHGNIRSQPLRLHTAAQ